MAHSIAYEIGGSSYENMTQLKAAGFIDFAQVVHAGAGPDPNFVAQCNALKITPIFQNGNDGIAGMGNNDPDTYYAQIFGTGYHAVAGESEPANEISAVMRHGIFETLGGEYWGCGSQFSDIFAHGAPPASGHGMAACLETYIGMAGVDVCMNEIVPACVSAKNHGCKEVGILLGGWIAGHPELGYTTAAPYIRMIQAIESAGVTVRKVGLWWGFGVSMWGNYMANGNNDIIKGIQAVYPPDMTPMKQRFAGVVPPPPTPKIPTKITLTADKKIVGINEPVTFTATLTGGAGKLQPNKNITINHQIVNGLIYKDTTARTDANGQLKYTATFKGTYAERPFYATFAGDAAYASSVSQKQVTIVCPKP